MGPTPTATPTRTSARRGLGLSGSIQEEAHLCPIYWISANHFWRRWEPAGILRLVINSFGWRSGFMLGATSDALGQTNEAYIDSNNPYIERQLCWAESTWVTAIAQRIALIASYRCFLIRVWFMLPASTDRGITETEALWIWRADGRGIRLLGEFELLTATSMARRIFPPCMFIIDREAGAIIRLVASVCLCALSCLNRLTFDLDFWREGRPWPWLAWGGRSRS